MAGYFAIFLVALTIGSGLIWLFDALVLAPKRKMKLAQAEIAAGTALTDEVKQQIAPQSYIAETAQSIFPLIAMITILRSFLYEPFQIPSDSMMPTLLDGDFILVEKYSYDVKDPIWRTTLFATGQPKHGDVAVFKYPSDPNIDYIKRIIGLPGDRIVYQNKQLYIQAACADAPCGSLTKVALDYQSEGQFMDGPVAIKEYSESLTDELTHNILVNPRRAERVGSYYQQPRTQMVEWIVPEGQYFAMGDNRDDSLDSRFWGFVPEANLVGKAVAIWISFEFGRDSSGLLPAWVPTDVRFKRIGGIQ